MHYNKWSEFKILLVHIVVKYMYRCHFIVNSAYVAILRVSLFITMKNIDIAVYVE